MATNIGKVIVKMEVQQVTEESVTFSVTAEDSNGQVLDRLLEIVLAPGSYVTLALDAIVQFKNQRVM